MTEDQSPLLDHIKLAEGHMQKQDIDAACEELIAAAKRFMSYKEMMTASMDETISKLSTIGCEATPPHPNTLNLIRLRDKLSA